MAPAEGVSVAAAPHTDGPLLSVNPLMTSESSAFGVGSLKTNHETIIQKAQKLRR